MPNHFSFVYCRGEWRCGRSGRWRKDDGEREGSVSRRADHFLEVGFRSGDGVVGKRPALVRSGCGHESVLNIEGATDQYRITSSSL